MTMNSKQRFYMSAALLVVLAGCASPPVTYQAGPDMMMVTDNVKKEAPPEMPIKLEARAEKSESPAPKQPAVARREIKKVIEPLTTAESLKAGINERLSKVPVVGYPPYRAYIRPNKMAVMLREALPIVREGLKKLPEGYVLRITGHANQHPRKRRAYTIWIARRRGWRMHNYLVRIGLPRNKMIYRGVANDQPLDPARPRDPRNRRVSFDFIPKSEAGR